MLSIVCSQTSEVPADVEQESCIGEYLLSYQEATCTCTTCYYIHTSQLPGSCVENMQIQC